MDVDGVTVLLVGSGLRHALSLEGYLLKRGCNIYIAASKNEAIELFHRLRFDLVLTEFVLSDGTAYELIAPLLSSGTIMFFCIAVEDGCWWMTGVFNGQDCSEEPGMRATEFGIRLNEIIKDKLFQDTNNLLASFTDVGKDVTAGFGGESSVSIRRHTPAAGAVRASGAGGHANS